MQLAICPFMNLFLATAFLILVCVPTGNGSCDIKGFCCTGRNISCASFDWLPDKNGKLSWKRCFCDEFCMEGDDCCEDYRRTCGKEKKKCVVSPWSKWSRCSKKCGLGISQRTRVVIKPADKCMPLKEIRTCVGSNCPKRKSTTQHEIGASRRIREAGRIIPLKYSKWRDHRDFSMKKDIRKNLYKEYHAKEEKANRSLCARYTLKYVKPSCANNERIWARSLKKGHIVCVSCHPYTINSRGGRRCPGIGDFMHTSRWKAVGASYCDGTWKRISIVRPCDCAWHQSLSFTFV